MCKLVFNDTATTEIYTLSLHAALTIFFRMRDEKGVDDKVVCVPLEDPNWNHINELEELPQPLRDEISHFFSIYKQPERSEEHTSELQSRQYLVCRLLLVKTVALLLSL